MKSKTANYRTPADAGIPLRLQTEPLGPAPLSAGVGSDDMTKSRLSFFGAFGLLTARRDGDEAITLKTQ